MVLVLPAVASVGHRHANVPGSAVHHHSHAQKAPPYHPGPYSPSRTARSAALRGHPQMAHFHIYLPRHLPVQDGRRRRPHVFEPPSPTHALFSWNHAWLFPQDHRPP